MRPDRSEKSALTVAVLLLVFVPAAFGWVVVGPSWGVQIGTFAAAMWAAIYAARAASGVSR